MLAYAANAVDATYIACACVNKTEQEETNKITNFLGSFLVVSFRFLAAVGLEVRLFTEGLLPELEDLATCIYIHRPLASQALFLQQTIQTYTSNNIKIEYCKPI